MEDFEIVQLFLKRSETAIERICEKYGRLCSAIAARILDDARDVEECVNDAWIRIWNSIPPEVPQSLKAYASAVVRNLAIDRYSYNAAEKRATALTEAYEELEPCLPGEGGMFDGTNDRGEFRIFLNSFLETLSKENRVMFVKRYWFGYSVGEISQELGVSDSKVKSSLFRTRNKMLNAMLEEGITL